MGQLRIPFLFVLIAALVVLTIFTPLMTARSQLPSCVVSDDGVIIADVCPGSDLGARVEAAEAASSLGATIVVLTPVNWTTPIGLYGRSLVFRGGTFTYTGTQSPAIALGNAELSGAGYGLTALTSTTVTGMVGILSSPAQHAISISDITIDSSAPTASQPLVNLGRSYVGAVVQHVQFRLHGQAVNALYLGGTNFGPTTVEDAWVIGSGIDNILVDSPAVWGGGGQVWLSRITTEQWGASHAGINIRGVAGGGYSSSIRDVHCEATPTTNAACVRTNVRAHIDTVVWFGSYPSPGVSCAVVWVMSPPAWNNTFFGSIEMTNAHAGCAVVRNDQSGVVTTTPVVTMVLP